MLWWTRMQLRWSWNRVKRWGAAEKLGASGNVRAVKSLISALRDSDPAVRNKVAKALGKIGDARAAESLVTALKDSNHVVREVARSLVKLGDVAVEPLILALKNSDRDVRQRAALILRQIGDARAVEPFIGTLKDSDIDVRREAARALGEIGDTRATEPLIAALKDSDVEVCCNAASALGKIGDERSVESLIPMLKNSEKHVRQAAATALVNMRYEPADQTQRAVLFVANEQWEDAAKLGAAAVEPLIVALKGSCLCWCCEEAAGKSIIHSISHEMISECIHVKAAKTLGEIGDIRAVEPLITALKNSNRHVWWGVSEVLVKIGNITIGPLMAVLKDSDDCSRRRAGKTLGSLGFKPADEMQRAMLLVANEEWENAVELGAAAVEPLIVALKGSSLLVQEAAALALGKIGDARAVEPLIATLKVSDKDLRWKAAEALREIGDSRAAEPLITMFIKEYNDLEASERNASIGILEDQIQILIELARFDSPQSINFVKPEYEQLADFFADEYRKILVEKRIRVGEVEARYGGMVAYCTDEQVFLRASDERNDVRKDLDRWRKLKESFFRLKDMVLR